MKYQKCKKTSSVANTLKVLKNHIDRAHRGISSCRPDDVHPLPKALVLLPFGIIIVAYFLKFVNSLTYDLYICTIF